MIKHPKGRYVEVNASKEVADKANALNLVSTFVQNDTTAHITYADDRFYASIFLRGYPFVGTGETLESAIFDVMDKLMQFKEQIEND